MRSELIDVDPKSRLDTLLNGLRGAVDKVAENISPPDTSIVAQLESIRITLMEGLADISQAIIQGSSGGADPTIHTKLDKIIALLESDPEALKNLAAKIKSQSDLLETAVKNQQQPK